MNAGFGAEEQATRRGRKVERLRRDQESAGATTSAVAAALAAAERDQRNWSAGAEGERMVAQSLEVLGRYGWITLHDVHWPGRPQANIDHVAIGPGGVVVIDAKNWSGVVTLTDGVLRQNGYRRDRELEGAASATAALTAILAPTHRSASFGVICLASQDQEAASAGPGIRVVGRAQLASFLAGLPPRLSPYDVADLGRHLSRELAGTSRPRQVTTADAWAALSPGRPERSAQVPSRRRPVRARASAATVAPMRSSQNRQNARARRSPAGRAAGRGRSGGSLLARLVVGSILALVLFTNAPAIGAAISSMITSAVVVPAPSTTTVVPVPAVP